MAWNDLTIAQRSQLMNMMRHNGITSLSEMKRIYDTMTPSIQPSTMDTFNMYPSAPVYARGGNLLKRGGYSRNAKSDYGAKYYDVVNMHYNGVMNEMRKRGFSFQDAQRLAPFLIAQLTKEGGWRNDREDNNYGGLRSNNGTVQMSFDSLPEFYSAYIDTLDRRWGAARGEDYDWRNSTSLEDYASRLNREDLGLHTKEQYDAYNAAHKNDPVYLYTPEWENARPLRHLLGDTQGRTNAYLNMIYQEDPIANWDEIVTGQPPRGSEYYTHLRKRQEDNFEKWYSAYARVNGLDTNPNDPRHAYDYRGFYRSLNDEQRQSYLDYPGRHLPDTYKWPTHPTFSQESKYYNPRTMKGVGTWDGNTFQEGEYNRAMQNLDAFNLSLEQIQDVLNKNAYGGWFASGGTKEERAARREEREAKYASVDATRQLMAALNEYAASMSVPKQDFEIPAVSVPTTTGYVDVVVPSYVDTPDITVPEEKIPEPINLFSDKAKARRRLMQRYVESNFNNNAKSGAGARGPWQIMPITEKDYLGRGRGKTGNIYSEEYNGGIRDWVFSIIPRDMQDIWSDDWSDLNKLAVMYGAYNWGAGNMRKYLRNLKNKGVDISDPDNWVGGLNNETRDYVTFLALDRDIPGTRMTKEKFEASARKAGLLSEGGRLFGPGGPIHIKKKNRGKFTALKKRTGHSASWFKAHGTPAQKKMAVFALNAKKWKHSHGGIKF